MVFLVLYLSFLGMTVHLPKGLCHFAVLPVARLTDRWSQLALIGLAGNTGSPHDCILILVVLGFRFFFQVKWQLDILELLLRTDLHLYIYILCNNTLSPASVHLQ